MIDAGNAVCLIQQRKLFDAFQHASEQIVVKVGAQCNTKLLHQCHRILINFSSGRYHGQWRGWWQRRWLRWRQ